MLWEMKNIQQRAVGNELFQMLIHDKYKSVQDIGQVHAVEMKSQRTRFAKSASLKLQQDGRRSGLKGLKGLGQFQAPMHR